MDNARENFSAISKLKFVGNQTDALAARLFYERMLGAANFHPPGISQKTIICIKKINAPAITTGFFTNSSAVWEKNVRESIEKLLRRAFRPISESVPAQAECVVFEDKAEMLACLARDWTRGIWIERWWWRAVFPNLFRGQSVVKILLDEAQFVPAAVQILSETTDAIRFVEKLEPSETFELLQKLTEVFSLKKLNAALFEPFDKKAAFNVKNLQKSTQKIDANESPAAKAFAALIGGRLSGIKIEDLSFERQSLLETALLLVRSPRIVRSTEFAEFIKMRRLSIGHHKSFAPAEKTIGAAINPVTAPEKDAAEKPQISPKLREESRQERSKIAKPETFVFSRQAVEENQPEISRTENTEKNYSGEKPPIVEAQSESAVQPPKIEFESAQTVEKAEKLESKQKGEEFIKPPSIVQTTREQIFENFFEDDEEDAEYSFQTRFGGIFYLLNLGLFLGLYRDFTESQETEIDLNIWDFTALLGLEFIGERIKSDALWDFLKRAAGRESGKDFGREFDELQDWRINSDWLETFPKNQKWSWSGKSGRLVVRHPAGFNVLDAAANDRDFKLRLESEAQNYRKYCSEIIKAGKRVAPRLRSKIWLENLAEYLQTRMFQALGAQTSEELNAVLFERRATVSVSTTHLEINFNLADLPLEIRLAGIDRDPGWIPAAGKFVYFHFV